MTATIEIKRVSKRYGKIEAVRDVTLDLSPGEATALVGHNGAGKTTLLKLMLGLVHPTAGTIRVLGDNPAAGEFAARCKLGYLPENGPLYTDMSPADYLEYAGSVRGMTRANLRAAMERVAASCRIEEV